MVVAATAAPEQIGLPPFRDDFTSIEDLPVLETEPVITEPIERVSTEPHAKPGLSREAFLLSLAFEVEFHRGEVRDVDKQQREMPEEQAARHRRLLDQYLPALALSYPVSDEISMAEGDVIIPLNLGRPV